ncbi:MAG: hemerythrin domain-containing protein [Paracoccus sp. (in: a-proteobacteria)]|uniref:hemerythrin domain-containing protein n=1 Tax=Paracoccus sp. TaxID=267 RepID=UPI0026E0F94C|nr:hemerythrin domain-containing protein [Paracoccus sp. (in: a-proteobacteria)]MDO5632211.1 hemerythrin domain-containing protein [Paracoccus sp. (in: a-proteobacteria)]
MTPEQLEDDAARPKAPPIPGLTPMQELHGKGLARIHRMYLKELTAVARLMADIRAGQASPQALPSAIAGMTLTQNLALFGSVCGRQCALLQNHHDIEEHWMFPAIAEHEQAGLGAVLERLKAEHKVIHSLIGQLRQVAEDLAQAADDAGFAACATAFDRLDRAIRSHFGYEETQLGPAMGYLGIPV